MHKLKARLADIKAKYLKESVEHVRVQDRTVRSSFPAKSTTNRKDVHLQDSISHNSSHLRFPSATLSPSTATLALAMASSDRVMHIAGTRVRFPHVPYRAQSALMHATITAITSRKHALVESPTGTGKTLALLCASLAFQEAAEDRRRQNIASQPAPDQATDLQQPSPPLSDSPLPAQSPPNAHQSSVSPPSEHGSDSDSDFAAPKKFRDVSWQRSIREKRPSSALAEEPANAFMFSRLVAMERDRPLDVGCTQGPVTQDEGESASQASGKKVPRVFYATRTHKQVTHVIAELRKTRYRPRISVLASRGEYCIKDDVRTGPARDETCKALVKVGDCKHHFAAGELADHKELVGEAWDIEELTELGRKHGGCPYYASHELYQKAQLIFCPYSFLVDPVVRGARGINLAGDVVILDEAHNIENYARESAGFEADVADMRRACDEVDTMILTGRFSGESNDLGAAYRSVKGPLEAFMTLVDTVVANDELRKFEKGENAVFEREELLQKLAVADVTEEQVKRWRASYEFVVNYGDGNEAKRRKGMGDSLDNDQTATEPKSASTTPESKTSSDDKPATESKDVSDGKNASTACQNNTGTRPAGHGYGWDPNAQSEGLNIETPREEPPRQTKHGKFRRTVRRRGRGRRTDMSADEQTPWVAKCMSMTHSVLTTLEYFFAYPNDFALVAERKTVDFVTAIKVNLFCLNAAVCFRDISNKARSVIVTSGTLSPIESFAGELGTTFAISKSLPHVIDVRKQLFVSVVGEGPGREPFDATFAGSSKFSFQDSLGDALFDYCKVVPGGVLVFFPSYRLMDQLHMRWKSSGAWEKLHKTKGAVLVEPHQRGDDFDQIVDRYQRASNSEGGALLFGVCRGKLSEGVDFRDATSRAVILVGIPFPYMGDIVVNRKRQWNDRTRKSKKAPQLQSGAEWYEMQAYRALNQALGRAVRHRYDYGAILLLDCRFRQQRVLNQLPKWTQAGIQKTDGSHSALLRGLEHFYRTVQEKITATVVNR